MKLTVSVLNQSILLMVLGLGLVFHESEKLFLENELRLSKPVDRSEELAQLEFELKAAKAETDSVKSEILSEINKVQLPKSLALENLRMGLRAPASIPKVDSSTWALAEIKESFRDKKYQDVIKKADSFLKQSNGLLTTIEVRFFLAESYVVNRQFEKATDTIQSMIEQAPDHILTGYSMLRLAQISEDADQIESAKAIYKIIKTNFNDSVLIGEANDRLQKLEK